MLAPIVLWSYHAAPMLLLLLLRPLRRFPIMSFLIVSVVLRAVIWLLISIASGLPPSLLLTPAVCPVWSDLMSTVDVFALVSCMH